MNNTESNKIMNQIMNQNLQTLLIRRTLVVFLYRK